MMYSDKCKSIIKSSLHSLTAALFIFSTSVIGIDTAQAQALQPGYMSCDATTVGNIDFGDINLVNPVSGTQSVRFSPTCQSSYYTIYYDPQFQTTTYSPSGAVCIGISSTNKAETSEQRYLYLNGDISSSYKLPFNFYFGLPSNSLTVGDGETSAGLVTRSDASGSTTKPAEGEKRQVPIFANMIAGFDFSNTGLPVGDYTNIYNIRIWTGAGDSSAIRNSICTGTFPELSGTREITVKVKVLPSCKFEILQHVDFGQHTQLTSNMTASGKLGVTCNSQASYEIQLNGGRSGDVNNRTMSLMRDGAFDDSQKISYNLFLPNSSIIWGNTKGTNTFTATAPDHLQQIIEVKGSINAASNPNPKVGLYRDNVTATIIY